MNEFHRTVLTIGHSTHAPEAFVALLQQHAVTAVADVRSAPYSRFNPQFNREPFAAPPVARPGDLSHYRSPKGCIGPACRGHCIRVGIRMRQGST